MKSLIGSIGVLLLSMACNASTFTVTTTFDAVTNDTNILAGTLRKAIMDANAHAGPDSIVFQIPRIKKHFTIKLAGELPAIAGPVDIDGDSQSVSYSPLTVNKITLDGSTSPTTIIAGLTLQTGNGNRINGINILHTSEGIAILSTSHSNIIEFNSLGLDYQGNINGPNLDSGVGVFLSNSSNNVVRYNWIGRYQLDGIQISGGRSNRVYGNYIGTTGNGLYPAGNGRYGIAIDFSPGNVIGDEEEPNLIAANANVGIEIGLLLDLSASDNYIQGNIIGLNANLEPLGNRNHGIYINQRRGAHILNNLIAANYGHGIFINGSGAVSNVISGNQIGLAPSPLIDSEYPTPGDLSGNWGDGIHIGNAQRCTIGGDNPEFDSNLIVGNRGNGIQLEGASFTRVVNNEIDGNMLAGLFVQAATFGFANGNQILSNQISGHIFPGVVVATSGGTATGNTISQNSIFGNRIPDALPSEQPLGIDLGGTNEAYVFTNGLFSFTNVTSFGGGPDTNDVNDSDGGPNNRQNYPVLTSVTVTNGLVTISGYVQGIVGHQYQLEFFSDARFPVFGESVSLTEGSKPFYTTNMGISALLPTNFVFTTPVSSDLFGFPDIASGSLVSATATDKLTGDTSEFSPCITVTGPGSTNHVPVALDDFATINEDQSANVLVLQNDTDVEDGIPNLVFVFPAGHGRTALGGAGSIHYTPNPGFNGNDAFTYLVADSQGARARAVVHVQVNPVNDPPDAVADFAATVTNTPVNIPVLINDTDIDGGPLTVTIFGAATHGVAAPAVGGVIYTPDLNYVGDDFFAYTVDDGNGGTDIAGVSVSVIDPTMGTDLGIQQFVSAALVPVGSNVTYSLLITNQGPSVANNVRVSDLLPEQATYLSASASQGTWTSPTGAVQFAIGTIPVGGFVTAQVTVHAIAAGTLLNRAQVFSTAADPDPTDNISEAQTVALSGNEPSPSAMRSGQGVSVSWPVDSQDFVLEQNATLSPGSPWKPVPRTPQIQNGRATVDVAPAAPRNFFRLRRK
jgi:uncharacterized repeat protein (TIGR01451 family)